MIGKHFSVKIAEVNLDLDMNEIEKYCYKVKEKNPTRIISNMGGYQCPLSFTDTIMKKILNEISIKSTDYLNEMHLSPNYKYGITSIWVNINGSKDYNICHTHSGAICSGTFYIKSKDFSGDIVFENPSKPVLESAKQSCILDIDQADNLHFPPLVGTMYLFPSWLRHYVEQNKSNEDRISIAFNIDRIR